LRDDARLTTLDRVSHEEDDIQAIAAHLKTGLRNPESNPYLERLVGAAMGDEAATDADLDLAREPVLTR